MQRSLEEEEAWVWDEKTFTADGIPLSQVISFTYLGRILTATDDYWPAVVRNLRKARREWKQLTRVL